MCYFQAVLLKQVVKTKKYVTAIEKVNIFLLLWLLIFYEKLIKCPLKYYPL